jgi:hypothetical protein
MRAIGVIIRDVVLDETAQVSLIEDEYVIQKISATAPDPAFRHSIGPSRQQHPMRTLKMESSKSHTLFIVSGKPGTSTAGRGTAIRCAHGC